MCQLLLISQVQFNIRYNDTLNQVVFMCMTFFTTVFLQHDICTFIQIWALTKHCILIAFLNTNSCLKEMTDMWKFNPAFLPWYTSSLHFVGNSNVSGPHVVLPAFLTQHAPQDCTTVNSNPHVNIFLGFLSNIAAVICTVMEWN